MGLFTDIADPKKGAQLSRTSGGLFSDISDSWVASHNEGIKREANRPVNRSYAIPGSMTDKLLGRDLVGKMTPQEFGNAYRESLKSERQRETERLQKVDTEASALSRIKPKEGATISAGKQSFADRFRSALPESVAEKVFDPIREGLFGRGQFTGDKGLTGFVAPPLNRDKGEQIMTRYEALVKSGTPSGEALIKAQEHAAGNTSKLSAKERDALKGVSFMENRAGWHHKLPSKEELEQAFAELDKQMEDIENGR
jgi:hypothetical protein